MAFTSFIIHSRSVSKLCMAVFALDHDNLTIMIIFMNMAMIMIAISRVGTKPKTTEIKFKIIVTCLEFHPDQPCADISCSTSYCVSVLLYPFAAHVLFSALVGVFGGFLGCRLYRLGVFTIGECLGLVSCSQSFLYNLVELNFMEPYPRIL